MPRYPIINFLVARGHAFAIAVSLLPFVAALCGVYAGAGSPWMYVAGGAVASGVLYVIMKSYVELVAIIADMLLPK